MFCCIVAERHLLASVAFRGGQGIPKAVTRNLSHGCFLPFLSSLFFFSFFLASLLAYSFRLSLLSQQSGLLNPSKGLGRAVITPGRVRSKAPAAMHSRVFRAKRTRMVVAKYKQWSCLGCTKSEKKKQMCSFFRILRDICSNFISVYIHAQNTSSFRLRHAARIAGPDVRPYISYATVQRIMFCFLY